MTAFKLPLPPTTNRLLMPKVLDDLKCVFCGNRPAKRPMVRLIATGEARDFRRLAHRHLPVAPVGGPVELYVTVYLPTLASDGLNRIKALEDAINERLWFDDKQIAEWHIKRVLTDDESKHGVVFEVRPADPLEHPELARRLAKSSIQQRENEKNQAPLFAAPPQQVVPRNVPGESVPARLNRLARPATYRPEPDEPEGT